MDRLTYSTAGTCASNIVQADGKVLTGARSGVDHKMRMREKILAECENVPLVNPRLNESGADEVSDRVILVYISNFFSDETDFLYVISGTVNMSRFCLGTFSGSPHNRPCLATPFKGYGPDDLFDRGELRNMERQEVSKTETKGLRWKYLYESGVEAWKQLVFSPEKYAVLRQVDVDWVRKFSSGWANEGVNAASEAAGTAASEAASMAASDAETSISQQSGSSATETEGEEKKGGGR